MNAPSSDLPSDTGSPVQPHPLPEFDFTVEPELDPAARRRIREGYFDRIGFTVRNLVVLWLGSLAIAACFPASGLAKPGGSILAIIAVALLFLRHRLLRESGHSPLRVPFRVHLSPDRLTIQTEGHRSEIEWGVLADSYFETEDAFVLMRGGSIKSTLDSRILDRIGKDWLRSVLDAADVRRRPKERWTKRFWILWVLAGFAVLCRFSSPPSTTNTPAASESHAESVESAEN